MASWDSNTPQPQNQDDGSEWQPPANGWTDSAVTPPQPENDPGSTSEDGDWFDVEEQTSKRSGWTLTSAKGSPLRHSVQNAAWALDCTPNNFSFNLFSERDMCNGIMIDDAKVVQLLAQVETIMHWSPTKDAMYGAIKLKCLERKYHPVKEYLRSLEWDKKFRLNRCGETYFGTDETPLQNAICRLMIIGMVARVMAPGCQYDYMPILQGDQGAGKSTALSILAGEWFVEGLPLDVPDLTKIVLERSENAWMIECSDLGGWKGSDVEKVKSMVTTKQDTARMAYGHYKLTRKRQFTLAGTANPREILRDSKNRRFPIVEVKHPIGLDDLRRDRDQLLAEALHEVETHFAPDYHIALPNALWDTAEEHAQKFRSLSGFETWAFDKLEELGKPEFYLSQQLRNDMLGEIGRPNDREIGRVMNDLGYTNRAISLKDHVGSWKTRRAWVKIGGRYDK